MNVEVATGDWCDRSLYGAFLPSQMSKTSSLGVTFLDREGVHGGGKFFYGGGWLIKKNHLMSLSPPLA